MNALIPAFRRFIEKFITNTHNRAVGPRSISKPHTSLPGIIGLAISLVCHVAAYATFLLSASPIRLPVQWVWQLQAALAISAALSIAISRIHHVGLLVALSIAKTGILFFISIPLGGLLATKSIMLLALMADISAALPLLGALALGCVAIALMVWMQGFTSAWSMNVPQLGREENLFMAFITGLLLANGVFLRRYVGMLKRQREELNVAAEASFELARVNLELQTYNIEVERFAAEEERKRLTRELHDTIGYTMMNQITMMEVATRLAQSEGHDEELLEVLRQSQRQAQEGLNDARTAIHELRGRPSPPQIGLQRIARLVGAFRKTEITATLDFRNVLRSSFNDEIDYILYRAVQEGITNAIRHGRASSIAISLWEAEREIIATITDNGSGSAFVSPGIGLNGISERIAHLGGTLSAGEAPFGFQLVVRIPWTATPALEKHD
jgi:signal transduction histidine kinase